MFVHELESGLYARVFCRRFCGLANSARSHVFGHDVHDLVADTDIISFGRFANNARKPRVLTGVLLQIVVRLAAVLDLLLGGFLVQNLTLSSASALKVKKRSQNLTLSSASALKVKRRSQNLTLTSALAPA